MKEHFDFAAARVQKRMAADTSRKDFLSFILGHNDKVGGVSNSEISSNAALVALAGSETTATLLSGLTYWLLKNPNTLERLNNAVQSAFKTEDDMNFNGVSKIEYLVACLEEGPRMYPPVPVGLPRIVPEGGDNIAGFYVPEGLSLTKSATRAVGTDS